MENIVVKKKELLKILNKNLVIHRKLFNESIKEFQKKYTKELELILSKAKKGEFIMNMKSIKPQSYEQDYLTAIHMVGLDCRNQITLETHEFMKYILNKWNWLQAFHHMYLSNSSSCNSSSLSISDNVLKSYFGDV